MSHESRLHTASITKLGYIRLALPEEPGVATDGTDPAAEPAIVSSVAPVDVSGAPDAVAATAAPDMAAASAAPDIVADANAPPDSAVPDIAASAVPDIAESSTSDDSVESLAAFLEAAVLENAPRARAPAGRATTVSYDENAERERIAAENAPDSAAPDVARASEPSLAIAVAAPAAAPAEQHDGVPTEPASEEKSEIIELPSFTSEETSRPTVQMPPLVIEREQKALDESFDPSLETSPEPGFDEWPDTVEHALVRDPVATLLGMVPLTVPPRPLEAAAAGSVVFAAPAAPAPAASTAPTAVPTEDTRPLEGITKPPAYDATFDASRLHRSTRPISSMQSTFTDSEVNLIIGSPARRRWIIAAVIALIAIIAAGIGWLMFMSVR